MAKKADWENEDFEPALIEKPLLGVDRWEGEDEEEDVKDNWDDDEEEKEKTDETVPAMQPKKKRTLAQIVAEKEEKRRKELEEKMQQEDEQEKVLSSEEILSEKLRRQKLEEEADLELAKETFGVTDSVSGIDQMQPSSKEDFESFRKELVTKITKYETSPCYLLFLEDLCRDLCLTLQHEDIKKISSNLNALYTEKLKAQKQAGKPKKKSKKEGLNVGKKNFAILDYGDEYEDCI